VMLIKDVVVIPEGHPVLIWKVVVAWKVVVHLHHMKVLKYVKIPHHYKSNALINAARPMIPDN
jgi:hypothetical protein